MKHDSYGILSIRTAAWTMLGIVLLLGFRGIHAGSRSTAAERVDSDPPAWTNQASIDGLYRELDLEDPKAVFAYVFGSLPDAVTVYPSEGYYYFAFPRRGMSVRGSILLDVRSRERGVLEFGYVGELEDHPGDQYHSVSGRFQDFGAEDGLLLEKRTPWEYVATYAGKIVRFQLYDPGHAPPAALLDGERYVGTSMDESGLRFHLVYDVASEFLFWMLDEDRFYPENLVLIDDHLCRGARTHFVFLRDPRVDRKLLIGVDRRESTYNTWYDGPFDQLPDTRIAMGVIDLRPMLAAYSGLSADLMDAHGRLIHEPGARVPVASYRLYESANEFDGVTGLLSEGLHAVEVIAHFTYSNG